MRVINSAPLRASFSPSSLSQGRKNVPPSISATTKVIHRIRSVKASCKFLDDEGIQFDLLGSNGESVIFRISSDAI